MSSPFHGSRDRHAPALARRCSRGLLKFAVASSLVKLRPAPLVAVPHDMALVKMSVGKAGL